MVSLAAIEKKIKADEQEIDELVTTLRATIRALMEKGHPIFIEDNQDNILTDEIQWDYKDGRLKIEIEVVDWI